VGVQDVPVLDALPDAPVAVSINLDLAEQNLRDDPLIVRGIAHVVNADHQPVTTKQEADGAAMLLAIIAAGIKSGEAKLEAWAREPNRKLGDVRALVTKALAPLVAAKERLAEKLVTWRQSEQVLAADVAATEARRLQEARAARAEGKVPPGPAVEVYPESPPTTFDTPHGQVTINARWTSRITDPSLLPDEYWTPDPKAVAEAVRRGVRVIPGCDIYQKDHISVRDADMGATDGT